MKERRKDWNPRGHRALSPPELRVLGKEATEMPERLGRRRVPGLAGLEPSARFCRDKFSDKNFSRPALRYTWAPDSESMYSAPTHACRRTEPSAAAKPLKRRALPGLPPFPSAGWASTAPLVLTLGREQLYPPRVPWARRALVAPETVRTLVSMLIEKGQLKWVPRLVPNVLFPPPPPQPLAEPLLGLG